MPWHRAVPFKGDRLGSETGRTTRGRWAGLIAIINQGRVLAGGSTLDGPSETLPAFYFIASTNFSDITSGSNGVFSAVPGYDEVTGLGTRTGAPFTWQAARSLQNDTYRGDSARGGKGGQGGGQGTNSDRG